MAVTFSVEHSRTSEYRFYPEDITIMPELNGRHELPDIEWLIADILKNGQHTPVVIRSDGTKPALAAGFSRWRAISAINERKLLGPDVKLQVRATYTRGNEVDGFLVNISENRARRPTTPIDDAHNIKRLLNVYGFSEEQVAQTYFPTAQTETEMQEALKFVRERIDLITLSPEAAEAVKSGRVKPNAVAAIAKLSSAQQRKALESKPEGVIERKDITPSRAPKGVQKDAELMRRISAVLEDIEGLLEDNENQYVEVDRVLLLNLAEYVRELKAAPKAAAA